MSGSASGWAARRRTVSAPSRRSRATGTSSTFFVGTADEPRRARAANELSSPAGQASCEDRKLRGEPSGSASGRAGAQAGAGAAWRRRSRPTAASSPFRPPPANLVHAHARANSSSAIGGGHDRGQRRPSAARRRTAAARRVDLAGGRYVAIGPTPRISCRTTRTGRRTCSCATASSGQPSGSASGRDGTHADGSATARRSRPLGIASPSSWSGHETSSRTTPTARWTSSSAAAEEVAMARRTGRELSEAATTRWDPRTGQTPVRPQELVPALAPSSLAGYRGRAEVPVRPATPAVSGGRDGPPVATRTPTLEPAVAALAQDPLRAPPASSRRR